MIKLHVTLNPADEDAVFAINLTLNEVNPILLAAHGVITTTMVLCGLMLHLLVLSAFVYKRKYFEMGEMVFISTIILGNILEMLFHSSTIPISALAQKWLFGKSGCIFTGLIYLFAYELRYYSLIALSIHRFCLVMFPFHYPRKSTVAISVMTIVNVVYMLLDKVWYTLIARVDFDVTWPTCDTQVNLKLPPILIRFRIVFHAINLLPGVIPFFLYLIMWIKGKKLEKGINSTSVTNFLEANGKRAARKQSLLRIFKGKRVIMKLIILMVSGLIIYGILRLKIISSYLDYGLNHQTAILIHFLFTEVVLTVPYLDVFFLIITSAEKRKAITEFLKKLDLAD